MFLTKEEENMLKGEYGEPIRRAAEAVVKVGEVLKATRLIKIVHAHISGVSYFNIGDAGLEFIEAFSNTGARFSVFTTANPYAALTTFKGLGFPEEVIAKQQRIVKALRKMGAVAFTCAPYYIRPPKMGEHLAWAESNAVLYANSIGGAHTNREGGPLALFEAIIGRTYMTGVHTFRGRVPECIVELPRPKSYEDLSLLGYEVGRKCPSKIPYVRGLGNIRRDLVRAFLSAFGATSGAPMVIIENITPGFRELLNAADKPVRFHLTEQDLKILRKELEGDAKEALYIIGCPHLSSDELHDVIEFLKKRCEYKKPVKGELWLITGSSYIGSKEALNLRDLAKIGIRVLFDVCPIVTKLNYIGVKNVIVDSGKATYYLPKLAGVRAYLKDRKEILEDFCKGES